MSIKIEGGGSNENVIKAGTSNELLYNDKEVLLKEKFGLLPPDLSKTQEVSLTKDSPTGPTKIPFTVPEDGWILRYKVFAAVSSCIMIDGFGDIHITPSQKMIGNFFDVSNEVVTIVEDSLNCPYPVKKGQVVTVDKELPFAEITFGPCMSI